SPFIPNIDASSEGLGDTLVGVTRQWNFNNKSFLFIAANVSLPTGSYKEKDSKGAYISYQGQLGSGTYDFAPYLMYRGRVNNWDYMTRIQGRIHTGRNDLNYRLGDEVMTVLSGGYWFSKYAALTAGFYYKNWREVEGAENILEYNNKVRSAARHSSASHNGSSPHNSHSTQPAHGSSGTSPLPHSPGSAPQGPPPGVFSSLQSLNNEDIFAASGARWSAQVGLKTGIYLGPIFRGLVEVGVPVYNEQIGPLTGLDAQWYLVTTLQSSF
ncbi:MAG: hypothetical protein KDD40_10780, partial [Bdellovibrionales bacterium]|nr:hypothetical protein [Bdellovibrionales bacterium]